MDDPVHAADTAAALEMGSDPRDIPKAGRFRRRNSVLLRDWLNHLPMTIANSTLIARSLQRGKCHRLHPRTFPGIDRGNRHRCPVFALGSGSKGALYRTLRRIRSTRGGKHGRDFRRRSRGLEHLLLSRHRRPSKVAAAQLVTTGCRASDLSQTEERRRGEVRSRNLAGEHSDDALFSGSRVLCDGTANHRALGSSRSLREIFAFGRARVICRSLFGCRSESYGAAAPFTSKGDRAMKKKFALGTV